MMPLGRDFDDDGKVMAPAPAPAPLSPPALDPMPDEPRTELGSAYRLLYVYGDRLHYVPA